MISANSVFEKSIQFVRYARSGAIVVTANKCLIKKLESLGWKAYCTGNLTRLNPPNISIFDIVDFEKCAQYQSFAFSFALYQYCLTLKNHGIKQIVEKILSEHSLLFKDFSYHISESPILDYTLKIEGSDTRIEKLKFYMLEYFLNNPEFIHIFNKYKESSKTTIPRRHNLSQEVLDVRNRLVAEYRPKVHDLNNYGYFIDFSAINFEAYDYIIFVMNGCFKFMQYFDIINIKDKILLWEYHLDKTKGCDRFIDLSCLINKKVLIVDSIYSGKTLLNLKALVENVAQVEILGVFPKSNSAANLCDYNLILNKVVANRNHNMNVVCEISNILGETI